MAAHYPFFIGGQPGQSTELLEVRSPFDGSVVGRTWLAGDEEFDRAAHAAVEASAAMRDLAARRDATALTSPCPPS